MSDTESINWDDVESSDFDVEHDCGKKSGPNRAGDDIDWVAVWDSCNLPHESRLSPTQIGAAIWVADATGSAGHEDQRRLCDEAVDAGALHVERAVAHTHDDRRVLVVSGYRLPREVRADE